MMKNANHMRTIHSKDKGWFWFGLTVAIQVVFIAVSYLFMNIPL
ncbi:KGW motif small protein [Acinetobacter sp. Z1]|nr:KGW motif small protein [Acinetobacter sp. Z1]UTO20533.1 KGW motif small protein [Acinetobacter sp. Z1]